MKTGEVKMLNVGDRAPEFMLKDKDGNNVSLSDFIGRRIVLYFYPKDNTPGCTRQACAFAGAYGVWQEKKLYGKASFGVVRTTFIIDENGIIEKVMPKVKPDTNAGEILEFL